jgi:hypothetical protein
MRLPSFVSLLFPSLSYAAYLQNNLPQLTTETKPVIVHFIVGNTYSYSFDNWTKGKLSVTRQDIGY